MSSNPSSSSSSTGRIPPQVAAHKAAEYLQTFVRDAINITVEEVELGSDDAEWRITLSYQAGTLGMMGRNYKLFRVNAQTGEVLSMRIRGE